MLELGLLSTVFPATVGHVRTDSLLSLRLWKEDLCTVKSNFEGCQLVRGLFMPNLCWLLGDSIQSVYTIHKGKGGKGGSESLRELTAGAEKMQIQNIQNIDWFVKMGSLKSIFSSFYKEGYFFNGLKINITTYRFQMSSV